MSSYSLTKTGGVVRFNFTGLTLSADATAAQFINLSSLNPSYFSGTLVSIRADVVLDSHDAIYGPADQTTATDLTVYIAGTQTYQNPYYVTSPDPVSVSGPANSGSSLQLGGTSGLDSGSAVNKREWDPNFNAIYDPSFDLTYYFSELDRSPPLPVTSFSLGGISDPVVWLGNGYTGSTPVGTWSGDVYFTFAGAGGSGVPDTSRTALLLAPGTLLLLGLAGRARRRD